jgi:hypothetical protein
MHFENFAPMLHIVPVGHMLKTTIMPILTYLPRLPLDGGEGFIGLADMKISGDALLSFAALEI